METTARLFNCAHCQRQVIICCYCDRGNIYCSKACSKRCRKTSLLLAGKRYQKSRGGRLRHAERQKRYRQRQKEKVTHHGSSNLTPHDSLIPRPSLEITSFKKPLPNKIVCHFCGNLCHSLLRHEFLHRFLKVKTDFPFARPQGP